MKKKSKTALINEQVLLDYLIPEHFRLFAYAQTKQLGENFTFNGVRYGINLIYDLGSKSYNIPKAYEN